MAFPVVESTNTSSTNSVGTNHVVTLPSGIAAGDLIVICMAVGSTGVTMNTHADYTELLDESDANGLHIWYRWATGGEGNPTFVSTSSTKDATVSFRISGASNPATQAPERAATTATSSSVNPDPPSVTPTGGAKDYLWITFCGSAGEQADDGTYCTAFPTTYTTNHLQKTSSTAGTNVGAMIAAATLSSNAASSDPGTFTVSENNTWRAQTIAIHPPAAVNVTVSPSAALGAGRIDLPVPTEEFAGQALAVGRANVPAGISTQLTAAITDNFDDNSLDTAKWLTELVGVGAAVTETSQRIELAIGASASTRQSTLRSVKSYNLVGSSLFGKVVAYPSSSAALSIYLFHTSDPGIDSLYLIWTNGTWTATSMVGGTPTSVGTYVGVDPWVRITESSGTVHFWHAPDSGGAPGTWVEIGTGVATPAGAAAGTVGYRLLGQAGAPSAELAAFDNLNVTPVNVTISIDTAGINTITNTGFETDTSGWTATTGATITRDTAEAHSGSSSGRVDVTTGANHGVQTDGTAAAKGDRFRATIWSKSAVGTNPTFVISEFNGSTFLANIAGSSVQMTGNGSWRTWAVQGRCANASTTSVRIFVITGTAPFTWWLDDAELVPVTGLADAGGIAPPPVPDISVSALALATGTGLVPDPGITVAAVSTALGVAPAPTVTAGASATVTAVAALATGTAIAPTPQIDITGQAFATGSAPAPTPEISVSALATAAGVAPVPIPELTITAVALATGVAPVPAVQIDDIVIAPAALAAGVAPVSTPILEVTALATATVVAALPTPELTITALATALGIAPAPAVTAGNAVTVSPPSAIAVAATVTLTAYVEVGPLAATAAAIAGTGFGSEWGGGWGTGSAVKPTIEVTALALALGTAPAPTVTAGASATVTATVALALGTSPSATPQIDVTALATAVGTAPSATPMIEVTALTLALGVAPVPTVTAGTGTTVFAVVALAAGIGLAPTPEITVTTVIATSVGVAPAARPDVSVTAVALATGAALAPTPEITVTAVAIALGVAPAPVVQISGFTTVSPAAATARATAAATPDLTITAVTALATGTALAAVPEITITALALAAGTAPAPTVTAGASPTIVAVAAVAAGVAFDPIPGLEVTAVSIALGRVDTPTPELQVTAVAVALGVASPPLSPTGAHAPITDRTGALTIAAVTAIAVSNGRGSSGRTRAPAQTGGTGA